MAKYGFTASIGVDTSGLTSADKELKALNKELNEINRALKFDPENTTLTAQRLKVMGEAAGQAEKKLELLKSQQEAMNKALSEGKISDVQYREYEREVEKAAQAVQRYSQAQRDNANAISEAIREQEEARRETAATADAANNAADAQENAANKTANWAEVMKGILASQIVQKLASYVTEFAKAAIQVGIDFDTAMSQVAATMAITNDSVNYEKLSAAAQEMGASTKYSATQAAEALNYLALAGYNANEAIGALPTVLNLAQAGAMDLASASDMITDSMSALGLATDDWAETEKNMTKFSDQLAKASQKSNTSVSQLGESILQVGATARDLKGGITEMNTVLGILADNGIKGADSGTALRNIILALEAPSDKAKAALAELNIELADEEGNLRSLPDIFADLNAALEEYSGNIDRTATLNEIFKTTDLKSINALLGTSAERFEELSTDIENSAGAAEKMAETMNDNVEGALASVNSAMEGFEYSLYSHVNEPIKNFLDSVAEMIRGVTGDLDEEAVQAAVADIGKYVTQILDNTAGIIRDVSGNILPIILDNINKQLKNVSASGADVLLAFLQGIIESLPYIADGALQIIEGLAEGIGKALPELTPAAVDAVIKIAGAIIDNIPMIISAANDIIEGLTEGIIKALPTLLQQAPVIIAKFGVALLESIPKLVFDLSASIANGLINGLVNYDWMGGAAKVIQELKEAMQKSADFMAEQEGYFVLGSQDEADRLLAEAQAELAQKNGEIVAESIEESSDAISEAIVNGNEQIESAAEDGTEGISSKAEMLDEALKELEHAYKTHNITEDEYWKERKRILEQYRDQDSEDWWDEYDKVTDYYDKLAAAEEKKRKEQQTAAEKAAKEEEKRKEEQKTAAEKAAKERFDALYDELKNEKITREDFNQQYIDLTQELAENQIDISKYAADKISDYDEKIRKENISAWEKSAKEITTAVTKEYDAVGKAFKAARDKLMSGSLIDQKVTDKSGAERYILTNYKKKTKELKKYQEDLTKLKETGISDELLSQVMNLSYDSGERQGYISEILKMSDKDRQRYYKDMETYYKEASNAAKLEVQDGLNAADIAAKEGIEEIYGSMPDDAYQMGVETAQSYIDGINETMAGANSLRLMSGDVTANTAQKEILQSTAKNQAEKQVKNASGNMYSGDTVVVINVAGEPVIKTTLDKLLKQNQLSGGNNTYT